MDLKELFEKIYNKEINENDVIVEHVQDFNEKYNRYIFNNGFEFWDNNGIISLSFFINNNTDNYKTIYSIISKEESEKIIEEEKIQKEIQKLENKLKKLKGE